MSAEIIVIGGTGLVGGALIRVWTRRGAQVVGTSRNSPSFRRLDIQDAQAVGLLLKELRPRIVAMPAANPHVDYCQLHPEETRRVNVAGSLNVARACQDIGARMIFYSSDYVFDGEKGPYGEEDKTCPINEYGRQKAEVESNVTGLNPLNLVIRTSGAYGWQTEPKNFVMQILSRLRAGQPIKAASDIKYNPTYVENLAEVTADLAAGSAGGLFHVVGADTLPRYEFARRAAEVFGLDPALVESVLSSEFNSPTPRPKTSGLKTDKVRARVVTPLWGIEKGLSHMLASEAKKTFLV